MIKLTIVVAGPEINHLESWTASDLYNLFYGISDDQLSETSFSVKEEEVEDNG